MLGSGLACLLLHSMKDGWAFSVPSGGDVQSDEIQELREEEGTGNT